MLHSNFFILVFSTSFCLVPLFDCKHEVFKNLPKWTIFGIFKREFFCDFQTPCVSSVQFELISKKSHLYIFSYLKVSSFIRNFVKIDIFGYFQTLWISLDNFRKCQIHSKLIIFVPNVLLFLKCLNLSKKVQFSLIHV